MSINREDPEALRKAIVSEWTKRIKNLKRASKNRIKRIQFLTKEIADYDYCIQRDIEIREDIRQNEYNFPVVFSAYAPQLQEIKSMKLGSETLFIHGEFSEGTWKAADHRHYVAYIFKNASDAMLCKLKFARS